ncbi:MAG: hypothetical protein QF619_13890, partial [Candidatus Binatia bacterium]|nr:hypothetical protein [Candidatus Binatia bacterium]
PRFAGGNTLLREDFSRNAAGLHHLIAHVIPPFQFEEKPVSFLPFVLTPATRDHIPGSVPPSQGIFEKPAHG